MVKNVDYKKNEIVQKKSYLRRIFNFILFYLISVVEVCRRST